MMSQPVLSVITPVLNGEQYVHRCYATLKMQTFQDWEWIVVDDGSTDATAKLVASLDDNRVRLVSYPRNVGRGYARGIALDHCLGEWVVIWDIDDMFFPDRLERINQARLAGYDFFCSYAVVVDDALQAKGTRGFVAMSYLPRTFEHTTLAVRLELARSIGYDLGWIGEDIRMILALGAHYSGMWCEEALSIYYEGDNISLPKAIMHSACMVRAVRRLRREGILKMRPHGYAAVLATRTLRRVILSALRLAPSLYLRTVKWRTLGQKAPGWQLSPERQEFLEYMRKTDFRGGQPAVKQPCAE